MARSAGGGDDSRVTCQALERQSSLLPLPSSLRATISIILFVLHMPLLRSFLSAGSRAY